MRYLIGLILIVLVLLLIAYVVKDVKRRKQDTKKKVEAKYNKVSQEQAKEMMDTNKNIIILDVRTQEEYDEKHIEGAILLPVTEIAGRALEVLPDKDATILVHCRSGSRSKTAADALVKMGYTNINDFGGINTWPYDTVSSK